jgi:hypothetical protein
MEIMIFSSAPPICNHNDQMSFIEPGSIRGFEALSLLQYRLELLSQSLLQGSLAVRPFSAAAPHPESAKPSGSGRIRRNGGLVEEKQANDITDQIPHIVRPMGVVEGTSYTVLIVAGLAFAGKAY